MVATAWPMLSARTSTLRGAVSSVTSTKTLIIRTVLYVRLFLSARTSRPTRRDEAAQKRRRIQFGGALGRAVVRCDVGKGVWPPDPECFDGASPARETSVLPCVYAWTPISPTSMILVRALAIGLSDQWQPVMPTRTIALLAVRTTPDVSSRSSVPRRGALPQRTPSLRPRRIVYSSAFGGKQSARASTAACTCLP